MLDVAPLTMDKTNLKRDALAGDVAVVTGATSNIGLGVARSLAWLGAKVVIAARNPQNGAEAADLIDKENKPGTALFVSTDVTSEVSVKAMAEKVFQTFGKVDILVNNAMDMSQQAPIMKCTMAQLDRQYEVCVRGALIGIQAFVPGMLARHHGVVTYLASSFCYPLGPTNYSAMKTATSSIIMSLANELGPYKDTGVSAFSFIPGTVGRRKPGALPPSGFRAPPVMPGYEGAIPPEDCGAALSYSIVRAADLHGSGIMYHQAFAAMNWPYPKPENAPKKDFNRVIDPVMMRISGYIGPGFPSFPLPMSSIERYKSQSV
jgi:NAD(P)-dependent dehydrogenase (short-subunit alcohol dehydrogenase family)